MSATTIFDTDSLARFRAESSDEYEVETAVLPLPVRANNDVRILSFDQSLANTGWAMIEDGKVVSTGNIKTEAMYKGPKDSLARAGWIHLRVSMLIGDLDLRWDDIVVFETPPAGSRMSRPESSYLAAGAIRICAMSVGLPSVMISAQKAKKRWTGNGNAKKNEVKAALLELHPYLAEIKPMNQATVDAISIGLVAAEMDDPLKEAI